MIVKVQVPLAGDTSQLLAYNESHTFDVFLPYEENLVRSLGLRCKTNPDGALKVYWRALFGETDAKLKFLRPADAADQGW